MSTAAEHSANRELRSERAEGARVAEGLEAKRQRVLQVVLDALRFVEVCL